MSDAGSVDRRSTSNVTLGAIVLIEMPPLIIPTVSVVFGECVSEMAITGDCPHHAEDEE